MNFGISSNYSNNNLGDMVKSMGLNNATQYFGSQYSDVISLFLNGQMSEDDLKKNLTTTIVSSVFSIFDGVMNAAFNKAGQAEKDVSEHSDSIDDAKQKADEINKISNEELRTAIVNIDEQTSNIQSIIQQAQEMLNTNFEEEKEQIAELQDKINEKVEELNKSDDPDKKADIITEIEGFGAQIIVTSASINQYITEQIEKSQADVLTCSKLITEQIDNSINTISQNLQNVKGIEVSTKTEGNAGITQDNTKGGQESAEAAALEVKVAGESAGAVFTYGLSGAAAASDEAKIADLLEASSTHLSGAGENFGKLSSAISGMEGISAELASNISMVGQSGTTAAGLIGSFETTISDVITSIGTITEGLDTSKGILDSNIEKYKETNGIETEGGENSDAEIDDTKKGQQSVLKGNDQLNLEVEEDLFKRVEIKAPSFGLS